MRSCGRSQGLFIFATLDPYFLSSTEHKIFTSIISVVWVHADLLQGPSSPASRSWKKMPHPGCTLRTDGGGGGNRGSAHLAAGITSDLFGSGCHAFLICFCRMEIASCTTAQHTVTCSFFSAESMKILFNAARFHFTHAHTHTQPSCPPRGQMNRSWNCTSYSLCTMLRASLINYLTSKDSAAKQQQQACHMTRSGSPDWWRWLGLGKA